MIQQKNSQSLVVAALALCACSLLQDPDSLSRGYGRATAGNANLGGSAVGGDAATGGTANGGTANGGASSSCAPANVDTSCDGLDQNCAPVVTEAACPTGCKGVTLAGISYMGCTISAAFTDAEILCQKQGMHLVEIDDASENNFVVQIAQTLGSYVWIGGSDVEQLSTFSWQNGRVFFVQGAPVPGVYENFAAGEPTHTAGLDCVQLHDDPAGPWSTARCADSKQFICQRQ